VFKKIIDLFIGTTLKKIVLLSLISITIFLSYIIKTIPNFEKKSGYDIVWKSEYDKYHQGYCLQENKIFSDEELFRRGIIQYLEKDIIVDKKIWIYRYKTLGLGDDKEWKPVGYYVLSELDSNDWYEKFKANYDRTKKSGLRDMLFNTFNAKPSSIDDINELLTIDMSDMTAGFKKPVVLSYGNGTYSLYLGDFLLNKDDDGLCFYNYRETYLIPEREIRKFNKRIYKEILKTRDFGCTHTNIDRCGNVSYDVEEVYLNSRELTGG